MLSKIKAELKLSVRERALKVSLYNESDKMLSSRFRKWLTAARM
jgi:hypothetical protein